MSETRDLLDVEATLRKLSTEEKVSLLSGKDIWHTNDLASAGVPSIRTSDGPNGVRGQRFFNGVPASCFPCATGLAASFDRDLVRRVGEALGDECRAKGVHVLLGPTVNLQRSPLGGRGFESFAEDPYLSGMLAAAYVNGVQAKGVSACIKHFCCNEQEFERFTSDSIVQERALREIYLEPFRLAVKHAKPECFMTSYNRLNGEHASDSARLMTDILRDEWGWEGTIMSDWTGTYSTNEAIKAGLDLEMPGPTKWRGNAVLESLSKGTLGMCDVDNRARAILHQVNRAINSRVPFGADEHSIDTPELRSLLRQAAGSAIVLLKNEEHLLPLTLDDSVKRIAVIGSNAKIPVPSGGGSASLASTYTVSMLQGITDAVASSGVKVEYSIGVAAFRYLPLLDTTMTNARVEFFAVKPVKDWYHDVKSALPPPTFSSACNSSLNFMIDGVPHDKLGKDPRCRFLCDFTPDSSGDWEFGVGSIGGTTVFIDGQLVVDNVTNFKQGELFFNMGSEERRGAIRLEHGRAYQIEVRQSLELLDSRSSPFVPAAGIRVGAFPVIDQAAAREDAVRLAENSDMVIVVVGTNADWESEGFDRKTLKLPGGSDDLVEAIIGANRKTIVVTQSGTPVTMPWVDRAPAIIHAFFGGNELGNGIADVLFGKVNPSGKLPLTFPKRLEDSPSFGSFGETSQVAGKAIYGEGVFVGYRHYQYKEIAPLWPFGHGLHYTTFAFGSLKISEATNDGECTVSFSARNMGNRDGTATAQVYVGPCQGTPRHSSPRWALKGFSRVPLKVGEMTPVEIKLGREAFSYWDEETDAWVVEKGLYAVQISQSSDNRLDDALSGSIEMGCRFVWKGI